MPYKEVTDLPDVIKDSLPADAQKVWMDVYNGAVKQGIDEDSRSKVAWAAVKNGWEKIEDKWVKKQEKKTQSKIHDFEAEIFSVGKWNGDDYSLSDLDEIVTNFEKLKGEIKPPVKLGHNDEQMKDGSPAFGWVTSLKRVGDKLIAKLTDVPDILYRAIQAGRYKRVSSEIYWNLKHAGQTFKRALAGVALLGADIPEVNNLKDLEVYLSQSLHSGSFEKIRTYAFDVNETGGIKKENNMDEVKEYKEKLKIAENALDTQAAEMKKEFKEKLEVAESALKTKTDEIEAKEKEMFTAQKETRADEIKQYCEEAVKNAKMLPAVRDEIINSMDKHTYSVDGYSISFDLFKKCTELHGKVLDLKEYATSQADTKKYESTGNELHDKATKYSAANKVTYAEAISAVLESDKDLAVAYMEDEGGE